ncbi:MAG: hypothetical protein OHK0053_34130 [Microscillaceae bacterium]
MDTNLLIFTTYQLSLALVIGLLTVFITLRVLNHLVLRIKVLELIQSGNTALALFQGSLIFCVLMLVETSILPSVDALRAMVLAHQTIAFKMFMISFAYFILFYLAALVFSSLVILSSFYIFIYSTAKVDEIAEIKKNNLSVSVLLSMVLISTTLFMRPAFSNLVQGLVNYDYLQKSPANEEKLEDSPTTRPEKPRTVN